MQQIQIPYKIGDIVYLKTDDEQKKYFLTHITISKGGVVFTISNNGYSVNVYDFEITKDKDVLVQLGIEN